jgi:HTH-type transcriptional regulator/antitoxin HigA
LDALLRFFGVASPAQWQKMWLGAQVAFRKAPAFESDPYAVSAWLRKGEIDAQRIDCAPYDEAKFRKALGKIRRLTMEAPDAFQAEAMNLAAQAGIALVFVPEIPRTRLSGATRWLSSDKGLIQLSLRYKSDDQLWFTFFHEAGHIVLHKKRDVFIEDSSCMDSKTEAEANAFASDSLIPPDEFRRFVSEVGASIISRSAIQLFARRIGIAPGIVVGRLQHEKLLRHSFCNGLKRRLVWAQTARG